jgi:hypothetical protein
MVKPSSAPVSISVNYPSAQPFKYAYESLYLVARLILISFLVLSGPLVSALWGQANVTGQWQTLSTQMPINPIHLSLMHNGRVLIVSGSGNYPPNTNYQAAVWDPATDTVTTQPLAYDMFCNGMVVFPDGRPFVMSGTLQYDPFFGDPRTSVFDPTTGNFTQLQSMAHGRWYPTATTLGNGSVMVFSGLDEDSNTNTTVEIYTVGSGWSGPYQAPWTPPLYPRLHLLPNGTVFYSAGGSTNGPASSTTSSIFNPTTHTWTVGVATTNYSEARGYGSSVLLPLTPANNYKPVVMIMGGGSPATATTELIDLSVANPKWVYGPNMSEARIEMGAVILPTGNVLALNGSVNDEDATTASLDADLYNPVTNTFSSAGAGSYPRLYHSGALLLPDATVLVVGGNPERGTYTPQMEIYTPAYLFNSAGSLATRPTITSVTPGVIGYGSTFQIQTPNAASITSAVLIRAGSPTHAFDMDQRLVGLSFTAGSGVLTATAPPNGNIAPPGYYLLFLLNSSGVPSVAQFVQLSLDPTDLPPKGTITSPSSPVSIYPNQSVSFAGTGTSTNGSIASYSWIFPGGTPSTSTLATPGSVTYSTSGTYVASLTVTDNLGVTDPSPPTQTVTVLPDFSLSSSPTVQSVAPGSSASYGVVVTPNTGFTGTVSFSVSGLPARATATFSPTTISTSGTAALTIATTSSTPTGSSTITITGTSGPLTHTTSVTLSVTTGGSGFSGNTISINFVGTDVEMASTELAGVVPEINWNQATGAKSSSPLALVDDTGAATTATVSWTADDVWEQSIADQSGNVRMMKGYLDNGNQDTTTVTVSGLPSDPNGYNVYVYADGSSNNSTNTGIYQISGPLITTNSVSLTYNSQFTGTFVQATTSSPIGNYLVFTIPNVPGFTVSAIPSTASTGYERAPVNGIQIVPLGSPNPDFSMTVTPSGATLNSGGTATYTVNVGSLNGFNGVVNFSATGLPSGAVASFSPASVTGSGSSALTITTAGTPAGSSTITITGTSGSDAHTATVTLTVTSPDFSLTATPTTASVNPGSAATYTVNVGALNGFTGGVAFSVTGMPTGATATFAPTSVTTSGSSTLTVNTISGTAAGSYTLTITGTGPEELAHTATVTLTVTASDFSLAISPSSTSVVPGGTATYTVTVGALNGFSGSVKLTVAGLPAGANGAFAPTSVTTSGTSTLTITTTTSTPIGSPTITVTGTSGSLMHAATATLSVTSSTPTLNAINIDFVGLGTEMAPTEVAGVVAESHWNLATGAKSSSPLALVDDTGAATTATVAWTSDDVWDESITDAPGNVRMMKGYLDNGQQDTTTVTVSGLPSDPNGYAVYVYADGAANGSNMGIYQISGTGITTTSTSLTYTSNFTGAFTQATAANPVGNYVVFTIPAVSGFTLSAIPSTASTGYERAPVNGMQIVPLGSPNPDFTLSAAPSTATANPSSPASYTVTIAPLNGFTGAVNLAATGLPTGATASFAPASVTTSGSSTLTITTSASTPAGTSTITITGTSGMLTHSETVSLQVNSPNFSVTASPTTATANPTTPAIYTVTIGALNGFSSSVSLSASGLPAGATATFSPASISTSGSSTLTITTTAGTTPAGSSTITIKGTSGTLTNSTTVTLTAVAPDFTVAASPGSSTVSAGNPATYTVTTGALNGFSSTVSLSAGGLPAWATATFSPASITTSGTSTLTITTTAGTTPGGSSTITITGTSGTLTHTATVTLTVTAAGFSLAIAPSSASVVPGGTATYTVTVGAVNGFTGIVSFAISGTPAGVTTTFAPTTVTTSGTSTLTIATTTGTPVGSSTLTVTGTSGTLTQTATTTLNVTSSAPSLKVISVNFVGTDVEMASAEVAGVVAKSNWNQAIGAVGATPLTLVDETGTATTATVTWTADDVWEQSITDEAGNVRMMKGYLDNGDEDTTVINVAGLPSDPNGYTVYVYADGATSGTNTAIYQISGTGISTTSQTLTYNANFNGTFTQATASGLVGNYVILTIPNVSGFTLSAIPSTASSGYERAPVNGIQIVPR